LLFLLSAALYFLLRTDTLNWLGEVLNFSSVSILCEAAALVVLPYRMIAIVNAAFFFFLNIDETILGLGKLVADAQYFTQCGASTSAAVISRTQSLI